METPEPFKEPPDLSELAFRMRQGFRLFRPGPNIQIEISQTPTVKPTFKKRVKDLLLFPWKLFRSRMETIIAEKLSGSAHMAQWKRKRDAFW